MTFVIPAKAGIHWSDAFVYNGFPLIKGMTALGGIR